MEGERYLNRREKKRVTERENDGTDPTMDSQRWARERKRESESEVAEVREHQDIKTKRLWRENKGSIQ